MTFTEYATAMRMRDTIKSIANEALNETRPRYRYAVVDSVDEATQRAYVIYNGDSLPVPVRYGAVRPDVGAAVRIDGKPDDRHVAAIVTGERFYEDNVSFDGAINVDGLSTFNNDATVNGDVTVNGDTILNGNALVSSWSNASNIDHLWHDDGANEWHFVSDGTYKQNGNSTLRAAGLILSGNANAHDMNLSGRIIFTDSSPESIIEFGNSDVGGPIGLEFAGGEGRLYYRTTPNTLGVEDSSGGAVMEWDVDSKATIIGGDVFCASGTQIRAADGSIAKPSYSFQGDSNSGFYSQSNGRIGLVINGSDKTWWESDRFTPVTDNNMYLGDAAGRWKSVWSVDGTINTSDSSQKEDITDVHLGLDFIEALRPVTFKWTDGGVRPHTGFLADEVASELERRGVDWAGYVDPAYEGISAPMGLRAHEFVPVLVKAIQELSSRIGNLEAAQPS